MKDGEIHTHYLGKNTQNEIIELISNGVRNEILLNLKHAKYYSIIVDCTQDHRCNSAEIGTLWNTFRKYAWPRVP